MIFPWNIAKSAEAMVSQWAVKRLCKFLLKKKLGKLILGDVDLDQLNVQLTEGVINLSDLALNVDYINDKLDSGVSIIIKEGSIGSLSIKMPWKVKGFQVEVDELELVLSPCSRKDIQSRDQSGSLSVDSDDFQRHIAGGKLGGDMKDGTTVSTSGDVHEGVKTIAKMVNWLLTSFQVKVKRLIVAYEPYMEGDERKIGHCRTLVLRISEIECGTSVSEESDSSAESFLGISQLTNYVKFQGAVLELLQMEDDGKCSPCASGSCLDELFSRHSISNSMVPIITGSNGGFSGNLKISIPWKNGVLDICKVDACLNVDPVHLKFQPSTIKWFLISWEIIEALGGRDECKVDSSTLNSKSHLFQSAHGSFHSASPSLIGQMMTGDSMLPGSHIIPDWVPLNVKDEPIDLGASVDQFFECIDGIRNSQSVLGSSGMWNWTCSMFSALTAASSLASGSMHIPSEQQHIQTNLKANLAGISIMLSFQDEYQGIFCEPKSDRICCLGVECKDVFAVLKVCPDEMRFDGTVKEVEVADYFCTENNLHSKGQNTDDNSQILLIQRLQDEVQAALPPVASSREDPNLDRLDVVDTSTFQSGGASKIILLSTSGSCCCEGVIEYNKSNGSLMSLTSCSLQLPHFTFWVNFWLVTRLLELLKDFKCPGKLNGHMGGFSSEIDQSGSYGNVKRGSHSGGPSRESFHFDVIMPNARLILCFPFETSSHIGAYSSWDQFIAIDFLPLPLENQHPQNPRRVLDTTSLERYTKTATCSLRLKVDNTNVHLVNQRSKNDARTDSSGIQHKFCVQMILSIGSIAGCLPTIALFWQRDPVTGPWILDRAKSMAASEDSGGIRKCTVEGFDFATVTTVKHPENYSHAREEMISSSKIFVYVHLYSFIIDLSSSQYGTLISLLDQVMSGLLGVDRREVSVEEMSDPSQISMHLLCDSVEIKVAPNAKEDIKSSLQSELPGSWNRLRLHILKLDVLSVASIGGIKDANFFSLAHGEGKLWGSISSVPDKEFLLISCNNSARKRGDGGGSNALSTMLAGSDILHLWDPLSRHDLTSITVRCSTIIAIGGRLDWFDSISTFFNSPSAGVEKETHDGLTEGDVKASCEASFLLKLVDVGLSYEPYLKNSLSENIHSDSHLSNRKETMEPYVACLAAASSLTVSSTATGGAVGKDFKIRVQDLGLLICAEGKNVGGTYSVKYLNEMGYVKVAQEALCEVILRTNCTNDLLWELECSKSHINLETCPDSTFGLVRLASQLQQLFAPDLEESAVHLQTRWNDVRMAKNRDEFCDVDGGFHQDNVSPASRMHSSDVDLENNLEVICLMDEIHEDAFHLVGGNQVCQLDASDSQAHTSSEYDSILGETCSPTVGGLNSFSNDVSLDGLMPFAVESTQTSFIENGSFPEIIEGYCLSDLRPLSELTMGRQSSPETPTISRKPGRWNLRESTGWYQDASLRFVEGHITEDNAEATANLKDKCNECANADDFGKATGRVLLKNINVNWRMLGGSDRVVHKKGCEPSGNNGGRDANLCLELKLCGIIVKYDFFPEGGIRASRLSLAVKDFYLYDRSKTAPWKMVLGYHHSKDHRRDSSSNAFKMNLEAVRPNPLIALEEYRLQITFLPMLLHLHQSHLDFLISFFEVKSLSQDQSLDHNKDTVGAQTSATKNDNIAGHTIVEEALLPFFQKFDIQPILLRVDYSPSRIDLAALREGKYVELVNLVPWKGVELQLKHVQATGVYGWGSVCETILGEWLEDISQNQVHKILRGLPPIRSMVAVSSGAKKLVSLPIENYKKDGKVLKGVQRGTIAFLRSLSLEAIGLGVHLTAGAHELLLQAEYILTSIPRSVSWPMHGKLKSKHSQPKDIQQGIQQAYESLSDGFGKSTSALVRQPLKKYQRGASAGSALVTAVQAVPAAAIAPVSACAGAARCTFLGLRNSLDLEHQKESLEKYEGPSQPPHEHQ